ncbi:RNA-directed DNA polymerase, eukaryota, reverse transcriptase zinc-binding domain protein [Tanacetum coccineum]
MKRLNENVHAIQVGCQTCGGAHLDKEFPLNKEVKSVEEVKYGEFGRSFANNRGNGAKYRIELGASINVMPYSLFKILQLTNLKETSMMVEMVDMTRKAPIGMVENVLVKIDKFVFPSDFMIIDMPGNVSEMMILGRQFLATIHAQIYVFHGEISLGIREDREPRVKRKEMAEILDSCPITSRWHVKIGHTHVDESVKNMALNEWILDIFDIEADFTGICNDLYSRSLYEYMSAFDNEIEQFTNQYELRIRKKGYILDDIWEKCERVHEETPYPWHDGGHEEEEKWENGLDNKYYDPPLVCVETFEVKRYSLGVGKSFVCVTKQLDEDLPLGRVNGTMFRGMIREEMDTGGSV